jgi:hypothetical protein
VRDREINKREEKEEESKDYCYREGWIRVLNVK